MKFNISYPITGAQKCIEIDDDKKCSIFYDKRMGTEVEADKLGDQFKGYILKITGGNDKDGFPMKQGILHKGRIQVLMYKGHSCYRPRRSGERKRKSVRGCIVGPDLRVLSLRIIKKGEQPIEGITDTQKPRTLGPKRATRIRKLFQLKKADGNDLLKKYVVRRTFTTAGGKQRQKAPKIQRLVTDTRLRRKRIYKKDKKQKWVETMQATKEYVKLAQDLKKKKLKKLEQQNKAEQKPKEKKAEKKPETQQQPKQKKEAPKKEDKPKAQEKKQSKK